MNEPFSAKQQHSFRDIPKKVQRFVQSKVGNSGLYGIPYSVIAQIEAGLIVCDKLNRRNWNARKRRAAPRCGKANRLVRTTKESFKVNGSKSLISTMFALTVLFNHTANATPIQVYGVWHAGNDAWIWGTLRALSEFDQKNHWVIDRGDGQPSVNLLFISRPTNRFFLLAY